MPKKLPRRVGDVLRFESKAKLRGIAVEEGIHSNSRVILVEKLKGEAANGPYCWKLQDLHTGVLYSCRFRENHLVKDVFLTKVYRAQRKSDVIHNQPEIKEIQI